MTVEDLAGAIRAADVGPFREVRLITMVHQQGVTKESLNQVIKEIKEVKEEERLELEGLKHYVQSVAPEVEAFKDLQDLLKKVSTA
jgi:hypothetical protein